MDIGTIASIALFGVILYYLLSRGPSSDMVFSSSSEAEVDAVRKCLEANDIRTYIKSKDLRVLVGGDSFSDPSLHVVDTKDYKSAIEIIERCRR